MIDEKRMLLNHALDRLESYTKWTSIEERAFDGDTKSIICGYRRLYDLISDNLRDYLPVAKSEKPGVYLRGANTPFIPLGPDMIYYDLMDSKVLQAQYGDTWSSHAKPLNSFVEVVTAKGGVVSAQNGLSYKLTQSPFSYLDRPYESAAVEDLVKRLIEGVLYSQVPAATWSDGGDVDHTLHTLIENLDHATPEYQHLLDVIETAVYEARKIQEIACRKLIKGETNRVYKLEFVSANKEFILTKGEDYYMLHFQQKYIDAFYDNERIQGSAAIPEYKGDPNNPETQLKTLEVKKNDFNHYCHTFGVDF